MIKTRVDLAPTHIRRHAATGGAGHIYRIFGQPLGSGGTSFEWKTSGTVVNACVTRAPTIKKGFGLGLAKKKRWRKNDF